jgi:hypothetical protein
MGDIRSKLRRQFLYGLEVTLLYSFFLPQSIYAKKQKKRFLGIDANRNRFCKKYFEVLKWQNFLVVLEN